ncbi:MAG: hypothetical protein JRH01_09575, partial [Deltaproteobacteria bacterium]|nr:hypothetical protein [Deltaproteobacteria bacterium]
MTAPRGPRLIDELSADLEPVRRPLREDAASALWLAAAWCVVVALAWLSGPFRPWLMAIARHKAIDMLRRGRNLRDATASHADEERVQ